MDIFDHIKGDPARIEELIARGEDAYLAKRFAAADVLHPELGNPGSETPLRLWLRDKHVKNWYDNKLVLTPELWDEWQSVKASYIADLRAKAAAARAEYEAKQKRQDEARRAELLEAEKRLAAEEARRASMVAKLQAFALPPIVLEPVDYEKLYALKKNPTRSKYLLAQRWAERFAGLPQAVQDAWMAFHELSRSPIRGEYERAASDADDEGEDDDEKPHRTESIGSLYLTPLPPGRRDIGTWNAGWIAAGLRDEHFKRFRRFNEGVCRLLALIGNPIDDVIVPPHDPHRPQPAQDVDEITAPESAYVVPGLIPRGGLTVLHGDPGVGKSLWLQKVAIVVADKDGATFEGIEVEHGQVIFATLDPSAAPKEIKPGVIEIRDRLGLKPSGRLHITSAPLILNEPTSVEHWLELNAARLPAKLIKIDSLFSAVTGSLAQDTVVRGAMDGAKMLLKHADAVVIVHHDNKGGDIFGSQFLTAMLAAKVGLGRNILRDGRPGNRVTVTVERLKFDPPALKLAYTLDGPFLSLEKSAGVADAEYARIRRPDILALLPPVATPIGQARKLVEHLLGSASPNARAEYWRRLRKEWKAAGLIVVKGNTIRRVA